MKQIPQQSSWFLLILVFLKNSFFSTCYSTLHIVLWNMHFYSKSYNTELTLCKIMLSHKCCRFYISQKYWQSCKTKEKPSAKPVNTYCILLFHQNDCCTCGNSGHKGQNAKFFSESQLWKHHLNVGQHLLLKNFSITPMCEPHQEDANKELKAQSQKLNQVLHQILPRSRMKCVL